MGHRTQKAGLPFMTIFVQALHELPGITSLSLYSGTDPPLRAFVEFDHPETHLKKDILAVSPGPKAPRGEESSLLGLPRPACSVQPILS